MRTMPKRYRIYFAGGNKEFRKYLKSESRLYFLDDNVPDIIVADITF